MGDLTAFLLRGGWVLVPILAASVISVAVSMERLGYWRREQKGNEAILDLFFRKMENQEREEAKKLLQNTPTSLGRILLQGLNYPAAVTKAMEEAALQEIQQSKKYLSVLDTIITLAPLLGLLGTVLGMISSFHVMATSGTSNPMAVTGGVAEALIATAAGLVVAIITLIPYNYFLAKTEHFTETAEQYATRLELVLEMGKMASKEQNNRSIRDLEEVQV